MPHANTEGFRYLSYLVALIFLLVNTFFGHPFYHVNSLKITMVLGLLALGLPVIYCHYPRFQFGGKSLQAALFATLPVWLSFPGYLYSGGNTNYYFPYELAAFCGLACWMVIVCEVYRKQEHLDVLFKGMGLLLIGVCLYAFVQAGQNQWISQLVKSTFGNRNYFVGFLLQIFPLFLSLGLFLSPKKQRFGTSAWFYWFVSLFCLSTLFLTRSRAGMGAALVSGVLVIIISLYLKSTPQRRKTIFWGSLGFVGFVLLFYVGLISFHEGLSESRTFNLLTFEAWYDRFHSYKAALNSILASPWVGHGLGSSYNLYFLFVPPESRMIMPQRSFNHVHSEPIEIFQEGGLLSFLGLIFFWGFIFFKGIRLLGREKPNSAKTALIVGLLGSFLAYNLQSLVSVAPRMMVTRLPLFLNLGLFFTLFEFSPLARFFQRKNQAGVWIMAGVPALFLIVAGFTYIPWAKGQWNHARLVSQRRISPGKLSLYRRSLQYDDVYTSSYLVSLFSRMGLLPEMKRAIDKTQALIPHYQNIDFMEGSYHFRLNDLQSAKRSLKVMQKYDRFHKPTNQVLTHIAVVLKDPEEWMKQFEILHYVPLRETGLLDKRAVLYSKVEFSDQKPNPQAPEMALLEVEKTPLSYRFVYHKSFALALLEKLNQLRSSDLAREKKIEQAFRFAVNRINQHSFFRIRLKPHVNPQMMSKAQQLVSQSVFLLNQIEHYAGQKEQAVWLQRKRVVEEELERYLDWKQLGPRVNFSRIVAKRLALYALDDLRF